jgi:hypothetical protein
MKRILLFLLAFTFAGIVNAQLTNLIFFTEQGERFQVILNGLLQNSSPETNVKITGLPAPSYKLKIVFEDQKLGEVDKTMYINQGAEITYAIRQNKKGEYIVRYQNEVPIAQAPPQIQAQRVIVYSEAPEAVSTTTTTTTTANGNNAAGMGISINDPSMGANVNVNFNLGSMGVQSSSTTTTTTTTTSSQGYSHTQTGSGTYNDPIPVEHETYVMPGYNGPYGCQWPMSPPDFEQAKHSIGSKDFEDSKLTIAKQIISTNCLLSSQVREIMLMFSFEDSRLAFAKYAYGYTLDLGNYYKVNDAFTFESTIDELNEYIQNYRR